MRTFEKTHPWLSFRLDLTLASPSFWLVIGECQSKLEHLAGVAMKPHVAEALQMLHFARGVHGTAAIEGNTLTEDQVRNRVERHPSVSPSLAYMEREIDNLQAGYEATTEQILGAGDKTRWSGQSFHEWNRFILRDIPLGGDQPGIVSRGPVGVAGYTGAPREDCDHLLDRLADWLNEGLHLRQDGLTETGLGLIKAIVTHIYVAWIHPWVDGNGRTARMAEYAVLLAAGIPKSGAHLLSNFYSNTRPRYYDELDRTSRTGGNVLPFIEYATTGFRDALRDVIAQVRSHQLDIAWESYIHEEFKDQTGLTAQRRQRLLEALTYARSPVPLSKISDLTGPLARHYSKKTPKTLSRDLNQLIASGLVKRTPLGFAANIELMRAFMPPRVATTVK